MLGANGAGKSSLLRIMAGDDDGYTGEARLTPGFTRRPARAGAAARPGQGRQGQRHGRRGASRRPARAATTRCLAKYADPDADYEKIGEEQARLEAEIEAKGANDLDRTIEIAMDALRLPPGDADVTTLSGGERRRVALCRLLLSPARPAAARRAHQPPRRRVGGVAGAVPAATTPGTVVAITHDRYFLDNVGRLDPRARPRPGHPVRGQLLGLARAEAGPPGPRGEGGHPPASAPSSASSSGCAWRPRPARPRARPASPPTRSCSPRRRRPRAGASELEIFIPPGDRLGDQVIEVEHLSKGYGDRLLIEDLSFSLPPAGIVGVIGPNGAGKTTLFRMLTGERGARRRRRSRVGPTVQLAYVDQSRDTLDPDKTVYEEITGGHDDFVVGDREIHGRAYVASFNFKGSDQQKTVGVLSGGERNRVHLAKVLQRGRQRAAARRAHQRPRRRHAARPRGRRSRRSPAARWSSATTAGSSTASPPTCSPSRATARCAGSRATSASTRRTASKELGAEADQPHRIKYKPLAR